MKFQVILLFVISMILTGCFKSEGKIRINSNQEKAEIFIDGVKKGETSDGYTTITVPEGDHLIRIFKEYDEWHYLEAEKSLFVGKDTEIEVSMRLIRKLTVAGIERERKKQKQLEYENDLYISGQYKQYLEKCESCQYVNKAKRKNDEYLYKTYLDQKSLVNANSYINNCILCYEKKNISNNLAFIKDLEENYIIKNDGTITNKNLKITWMRCKLGTRWGKNRRGNYTCDLSYGRPQNEYDFHWDYVDKAINKLNEKGYSGKKDWRLPTFKELQSLIFCKTGQISKKAPFCSKGITRAYNELAFPRFVDNSSNETTFWSKKNSNGEIKSINFSSIGGSLFKKSDGAGSFVKGTTKKRRFGDFNISHHILLVRDSQ